MAYTLQELKDLKDRARAAGCEGLYFVTRHPFANLRHICNGIGPEAFPAWLRDKINGLHPTLEPAAMIHDCEWHNNDGTKTAFFDSNQRLKRNGYKLARMRYAWFDPRRYIVMNQARRFGNLCQLFGWLAWKSSTYKGGKK
jgi:hypothetical protein